MLRNSEVLTAFYILGVYHLYSVSRRNFKNPRSNPKQQMHGKNMSKEQTYFRGRNLTSIFQTLRNWVNNYSAKQRTCCIFEADGVITVVFFFLVSNVTKSA